MASTKFEVSMISIHALREEGDPGCHDHCERYAEFLSTPSARRATPSRTTTASGRKFLSTPSARRATLEACQPVFPVAISIHALREEGDPKDNEAAIAAIKFLSTPSARRATRPLRPVWPRRGISIHALREEGDAVYARGVP